MISHIGEKLFYGQEPVYVLGNYDRIISDALEKQNRNGKITRSLILVTNIHRQARASQ